MNLKVRKEFLVAFFAILQGASIFWLVRFFIWFGRHTPKFGHNINSNWSNFGAGFVETLLILAACAATTAIIVGLVEWSKWTTHMASRWAKRINGRLVRRRNERARMREDMILHNQMNSEWGAEE